MGQTININLGAFARGKQNDYISVTIVTAHVRNEKLKNGASVQSYWPPRLKRFLDTYNLINKRDSQSKSNDPKSI